MCVLICILIITNTSDFNAIFHAIQINILFINAVDFIIKSIVHFEIFVFIVVH